MNRKLIAAHLALFTVAVIYAANYLLAKDVMQGYLLPRAFILFRVVGATLLFWLFTSWNDPHKITQVTKSDFKKLVFCGLTGVATNMLFLFEGLKHTTSINASIMMTAGPIAVLIATVVILKKKIRWVQIIGVLLGAVGAIQLIVQANGGSLEGLWSSQMAQGNLFVLINACSYAVYLVVVRPLMQRYSPLFVIRWVFTIGLVFVLPFGIPELSEIHMETWSMMIYAKIGFVIICSTFFTYLLNTLALKTVPSTTVGAYIYLQPLLTSFFAYLFTSERWNFPMFIGAIGIFIGVYLVSFVKAKTKL